MPKSPRHIHADASALVEDWAELLAMRQPGFDWRGPDAAKPPKLSKRGSRKKVDSSTLAVYERPMLLLLSHAPTGFPTFSSVRDAFIKADHKWHILGPKGGDHVVHEEAGEASDAWRKMCKLLYDQQTSGCWAPELGNIIAKIHIETADEDGEPLAAIQDAPADDAANAAAAPAQGAALCFAHFSDEEVGDDEMVEAQMVAHDEVDRAKRALDQELASLEAQLVEDDDDDDNMPLASFLSEVMTVPSEDDDGFELTQVICRCPDCMLEVPAASSGAQRQETVGATEVGATPKPTRRLRCKTTPEKLAHKKQSVANKLGKTAKLKVTKKGEGSDKRQAKLHTDIVLQVSMTVRQPSGKRKGEAYLQEATASERFVMGITAAATPHYRTIIAEALSMIMMGTLPARHEARRWADTRTKELGGH